MARTLRLRHEHTGDIEVITAHNSQSVSEAVLFKLANGIGCPQHVIRLCAATSSGLCQLHSARPLASIESSDWVYGTELDEKQLELQLYLARVGIGTLDRLSDRTLGYMKWATPTIIAAPVTVFAFTINPGWLCGVGVAKRAHGDSGPLKLFYPELDPGSVHIGRNLKVRNQVGDPIPVGASRCSHHLITFVLLEPFRGPGSLFIVFDAVGLDLDDDKYKYLGWGGRASPLLCAALCEAAPWFPTDLTLLVADYFGVVLDRFNTHVPAITRSSPHHQAQPVVGGLVMRIDVVV